MAPKKPSLTKPTFKEVRTTGRSADIVYLTTKGLENILETGKGDVHNDITAFNSFEGSVESLIAMLGAYYDYRFTIDYSITNEYPNLTVEDKISLIRDRLRITTRLMKRKGFLPADDVEAEALILLDHIRKRIDSKLDALIGVEGDRGSGKSYTALWLLTQLDKSFTVDRIFFDSDNFRAMLEKEKYPIGSAFFWDEATAGRGLNKKQSMTLDNIEFNKILQVIRKRRYIVLFSMPTITQIDSTSLAFFGGKITPIYIDKDKNICLIKYQDREKGSTGIDYWPYMRAPTGERITTIPIPKIDDSLADEYEQRKDIFLDSIIKRKRKRRGGKKIPDIVSFTEELKPQLPELKGPKGAYKLAAIQAKYLEKTGDQLGRGYAQQIIELLSKDEKPKGDMVEEVDKESTPEVGKPLEPPQQ
jgi:hypothetical protein